MTTTTLPYTHFSPIAQTTTEGYDAPQVTATATLATTPYPQFETLSLSSISANPSSVSAIPSHGNNHTNLKLGLGLGLGLGGAFLVALTAFLYVLYQRRKTQAEFAKKTEGLRVAVAEGDQEAEARAHEVATREV